MLFRSLGMVRQWQELFYSNRLSAVEMHGNPDFVALAKSYDIKGFTIESQEQVANVAQEAFSYDAGPCIIHAKIQMEENVFPMIPAGKSAKDIVLSSPSQNLEKPTGST